MPGNRSDDPASPLVALLNTSKGEAAGAMGVIAGDIEGGNWLKRLGVFASDRIIYEARDNDLVVNTDAMFHGPAVTVGRLRLRPGRRRQPLQLLPESAHPRRARRLARGADRRAPAELPRDLGGRVRAGADAAFDADACRCRPADRLRPARNHGLALEHRRPTQVWLRYLALLRGGLGELADVDAIERAAGRPVGDGYRELCEFLQDSHEVIPFAYDWRRSIVTDAARLLAVEVENALRRTTATGAHRRPQHGRAGGARDDRGAARPVGPHVRA